MRNKIREILREEQDSFDWIRNANPASKAEITEIIKDSWLEYIYVHDNESIIDVIYELGLHTGQVEELTSGLQNILDRTRNMGMDDGVQIGWEEASEQEYNNGHRDGYDEGYDDGYHEREAEVDEDSIRMAGYYAGYDDAKEELTKQIYEEAKEEIYYEAFEEGRKYQSDLDAEEYEKLQDPFTRELDDERDY